MGFFIVGPVFREFGYYLHTNLKELWEDTIVDMAKDEDVSPFNILRREFANFLDSRKSPLMRLAEQAE